MISTRQYVTIDDLFALVLQKSGFDLTFKLNPQRTADPELVIDFKGPDTALLLARNAELLLALEHIAAKAIRLEPEEHDRISCDAGGFKAQRDRAVKLQAEAAVSSVRSSGRAYHFRPMNSRERRLLHLALADSGLPSLSEGEGPARHLVLHPA